MKPLEPKENMDKQQSVAQYSHIDTNGPGKYMSRLLAAAILVVGEHITHN